MEEDMEEMKDYSGRDGRRWKDGYGKRWKRWRTWKEGYGRGDGRDGRLQRERDTARDDGGERGRGKWKWNWTLALKSNMEEEEQNGRRRWMSPAGADRSRDNSRH